MMPALGNAEAPVPPPAYHRAQARLGPALHMNALTDASTRYIGCVRTGNTGNKENVLRHSFTLASVC
jgi:hypothetical protein